MRSVIVIDGGFGGLTDALLHRLICLQDRNAAFHFQLKNQ